MLSLPWLYSSVCQYLFSYLFIYNETQCPCPSLRQPSVRDPSKNYQLIGERNSSRCTTVYPSFCFSIYLSIQRAFYLSNHLFTVTVSTTGLYISIYPSITTPYISIYLSINLFRHIISICLFIQLSIYFCCLYYGLISIYLSVYNIISICLSIHPSIYGCCLF